MGVCVIRSRYNAEVSICDERSEAEELTRQGKRALSRGEVAAMKASGKKYSEEHMEAIFLIKQVLGGRVIS